MMIPTRLAEELWTSRFHEMLSFGVLIAQLKMESILRFRVVSGLVHNKNRKGFCHKTQWYFQWRFWYGSEVAANIFFKQTVSVTSYLAFACLYIDFYGFNFFQTMFLWYSHITSNFCTNRYTDVAALYDRLWYQYDSIVDHYFDSINCLLGVY